MPVSLSAPAAVTAAAFHNADAASSSASTEEKMVARSAQIPLTGKELGHTQSCPLLRQSRQCIPPLLNAAIGLKGKMGCSSLDPPVVLHLMRIADLRLVHGSLRG